MALLREITLNSVLQIKKIRPAKEGRFIVLPNLSLMVDHQAKKRAQI